MLFLDSTSAATRHAVYAIERMPPPSIRAAGATVSAIVEQFPWGPEGIYTIEGVRDFIEKYAPGGMSRTGAGYLSVIGKAWPVLRIVRVLGTGAAAASVTLQMTGAVNCLALALKYKGAAGNSVTATVSDASDGDANHFNLTVSISNTLGTTEDVLTNLNYSGTGADSTPSFTNAKLLGSITKVAAGRPVNGTFSFTTGSDGTVTSAEYVGTQGAADKGISLLEGDKTIDLVFTGDPGNALRAAVNAGLKAHADFTTDRQAIINGNSGMAATDARTDVASYRSKRACYIDVWAYQNDDVDGTEQLVAPAPFFASVAANFSPSTSPAWKSSEASKYLSSIVKLEAQRGDAAYANELAGICTLQKEDNGNYTFEAAVNTNYPNDPSTGSYKRTRMAHYIAKAVAGSLREYVDAPNVSLIMNDEVTAVTEFLDGLKLNATTDPISLPHIVDYAIRPLGDFNTQASIDAGQFTIPADIKLSSDQSKIFFSMQIGETVKVTAAL